MQTLEIVEDDKTDSRDQGDVMHWTCGICTPSVSACGIVFKTKWGVFVKRPKFPCVVCEELKYSFKAEHYELHKESKER